MPPFTALGKVYVYLTRKAYTRAIRAGLLLDALEGDLLAASAAFLAVTGTAEVVTWRFRVLVRRASPRRIMVERVLPVG